MIMITTTMITIIMVGCYVESLISPLICKIDAWQIPGKSLKVKSVFKQGGNH